MYLRTKVKDELMTKVKGTRNIHSQAHATLKVVRLAILDEQSNHKTRNEESDRLKGLEVKSHIDAHDPTKDDQERCDEKSDLQAAADRNTNSQVHLVLVCNHYCCDMLGCIADDRDQYQANESLADAGCLHDAVNAADQVVRTDRNKNGDSNEGDGRSPRAQNTLLLFLFFSTSSVLGIAAIGLFEQLGVRAELEVQVHHVEEKENDGSSV